MNTRRTLLTLAGIVACATITGACSVATPDTSQAVLHFSGGAFSSQRFVDCVTPGTRQVDGTSDHHYYYPNGQRTLDFTGGPNADMPPLLVSARNLDGTTTDLTVRGVLTFALNTDCGRWVDGKGKTWEGGVFHAFHDQHARARQAFATDEGEPMPPAWRELVRLYVGNLVETALDTQGLSFEPRVLVSDAAQRGELQKRAMAALPGLIDAQAGGPYFLIHNLQIQSVALPESLRNAQDAVQAARLREQAAAVDTSAAANFPGGIGAYDQHQINAAIVKALSEGRGIPVPFGSSVIVGR
ncbi:MAG: hypothetical protein ACRDTZ_01280 [Pseudonocardiaceae bacterium]